MDKTHTFQIPVMGTGFSIDTPIKVAKYGISSVISLVDDTLIEQMRKFYCNKFGEKYTPITKEDEDHRARRITEYLNLVDRIVRKQFDELRASAFELGSEITKYFELLPETSPLKVLYKKMLKTADLKEKNQMQEQLRDSIQMGEINVNIMTKLDRTNYAKDGSPLPQSHSDALAAFRGYAGSTLQSAIVFSAGINQKLYSYVADFKDFYADAKGFIKKKIILKVSDYRSSIIQGKFFAKKGLWVSEYRVESGLNCGGHAFASPGNLMGPILEEFKNKRQDLISSLHAIYNSAVSLKDKITFPKPLEVRISAQGGIGTVEEDGFLRSYYDVNDTGWGSPFMLCPEAINVDDETLKKLEAAGEDDIYLSDVSPLGVPFSNLRGSGCDVEQERRVKEGKPGSACPKGHLSFNTEFTQKPICAASRLYQAKKLEQLATMNLPENEYKRQVDNVVKKACICHELGGGVRLKYNISGNKPEHPAVCPGPNLAYFSKIVTLKEIVDHVYGRINILNSTPRPHMFIKELRIYVDYLIKEIKECTCSPTAKQTQYFINFKENLLEGIKYYKELFPKMLAESMEYREKALNEVQSLREKLETFFKSKQAILKKEKPPISA